MLAAQHAPIGAKICTTRAIRTTGKKFFSRLRIANPSASDLITLRVRSRYPVPDFILHGCGNKPATAVYQGPPATFLPTPGSGPPICNQQWLVPNHYSDCSNFEQSLPKMVTRRKRWSTSAGSGWPKGRSLVVQVSGGALTRTSSVASSIKIKPNFSR